MIRDACWQRERRAKRSSERSQPSVAAGQFSEPCSANLDLIVHAERHEFRVIGEVVNLAKSHSIDDFVCASGSRDGKDMRCVKK